MGGVNSPVRAFKAVDGIPLFIQRARGSKIQDVDGNRYIDYVCSWGPLILGSAHPKVVQALNRATTLGTSYGAPTKLETELAELVTNAMPSIENIRFVSSGTEASMSALRLARAYTKRSRILKFEGCYHGHSDSLLVKGGSGMATLGTPDSAGVTAASAAETLVAPYNDISAVKKMFENFPYEIAAVIVEPVAANMGLVLPRPDFLKDLRTLTNQFGALLIFDEVVTGFRVGWGGAQSFFKVKPDLTCLGKIIGGGLPVGAYGGERTIMELVSPVGPVYQAGTLSGNPLAMTAGITTLKEIRKKGFYERLDRKAEQLSDGLQKEAQNTGCALHLTRVGSMLGIFFTNQEVVDFASAKLTNTEQYKRFFHTMLNGGVYFPPSAFETAFVSAAHTEKDVSQTLRVAEKAFQNTTREN